MKKLLYILMFLPFCLFGQTPPQVGDLGYGGVVFHVDEDYIHVVALERSPVKVQVGNYNQSMGNSSNFGDFQGPVLGRENIASMLTNIDNVYSSSSNFPSAAFYAYSVNINGHNDWYIPNNYEFGLINSFAVDNPELFTDLINYNYWSMSHPSSGYSYPNYACTSCMTSSSSFVLPQNNANMNYVLPIRSFAAFYGCTDQIALNFDSLATVNDSSCLYQYEIEIQSLEDSIGDLISSVYSANDSLTAQINLSTIAVSSLQQALDTWNTTIDLSSGWNMFGYGCPTSIDLAEGLSNHTDKITIVKDNNGNVYMPEFGFNGIGDLTPGYGYQIKVTEEINDFSLCDWYVNDIPEDNIVSLQEENDSLQAELDMIYGCTTSWACNYDEFAIIDDGTCYDNDEGCGCDLPGPIDGYDCSGNEFSVSLGDTAFGGVVVYIDESGFHGLIAGLNDIGPYQWGCYGEAVTGASGWEIGTGYQNTIDIVNQGCQTVCSEEPFAAFATLEYESNGYSDWYLPSYYELLLITEFVTLSGSAWTSTEVYDYQVYQVPEDYAYIIYSDGFDNVEDRYNYNWVRPIRYF